MSSALRPVCHGLPSVLHHPFAPHIILFPNAERRAALPGTPEQTDAERVIEELRASVFASTQLTVSAGIASNRMLAKIASDKRKPNGQYYVPPEREAVLDFVKDLPIRKIPGIGKVVVGIWRSAACLFLGSILSPDLPCR